MSVPADPFDGMDAEVPEVTPPTPTQAEHPWKAAIRTLFQVGVPAFVALVFILPLIIEEILRGMGEQLPPEVRAWLLGFAVLISAVTATLARIMAIPGVIEWTRRYLKFLAPDNVPGTKV